MTLEVHNPYAVLSSLTTDRKATKPPFQLSWRRENAGFDFKYGLYALGLIHRRYRQHRTFAPGEEDQQQVNLTPV
jgi:hypothetical protein